MLLRIIAILLGVLIGTGVFIGDQYTRKQNIITETNKINDKIISQIQNHELDIKNDLVEKEKEKIKETFVQEPYIIIYDFFYAYESMYNKLLSDKDYFEKITNKTFQTSEEYSSLNKIKTNLIVTKVFDGKFVSFINGVPANIECSKLDIKAPCVLNDKTYDIKNVKVVNVNSEFSLGDIKSILNNDIMLFYKRTIK